MSAGRGRVRGAPGRVMLTLTLSRATIEALDVLAERLDMSRGRVVDLGINLVLAGNAAGQRALCPVAGCVNVTAGGRCPFHEDV